MSARCQRFFRGGFCRLVRRAFGLGGAHARQGRLDRAQAHSVKPLRAATFAIDVLDPNEAAPAKAAHGAADGLPGVAEGVADDPVRGDESALAVGGGTVDRGEDHELGTGLQPEAVFPPHPLVQVDAVPVHPVPVAVRIACHSIPLLALWLCGPVAGRVCSSASPAWASPVRGVPAAALTPLEKPAHLIGTLARPACQRPGNPSSGTM